MINLGPSAYEAIAQLRTHPKWQQFVTAIEQHATNKIQASLDAPPDQIIAANFYARAFNDIYVALVAATREVNPRHVVKPGAARVPADV